MASSDKAESDFEAALRRDLPRGVAKRAPIYGRDRGLLSRWLTPAEMDGEDWDAKKGLMLGYRDGRVIGINDDRHMLTIAGSRAGKGVSLIIPNLIFYEGSAVVVDPKGENAARTARRRGKGPGSGAAGLNQKVFVLDPFGESKLKDTHAFNPLEGLDARSPEVVEDIGLFADALITHDSQGDRHWSESAQALVRALILLVVGDRRFEDRRNLVTVRQLILLTDPAIQKTMDSRPVGTEKIDEEQALMLILSDQDDQKYGYICRGMAAQLLAMAEKERGSVLSTVRTQTQWLDSPKMPAVLERSDFDIGDLKRTGMTIYLCLPATRMATHSRWLRLIVLMAINAMERVKNKPDKPVLFVLDEFPVLNYMQSIEMAAALMAGFGVKLWPIVQNIGQLMQHYSQTWQTFVANAGIVTAFGISDHQSLTAVSDLLGRTSIVDSELTGASDHDLRKGGASEKDKQLIVELLAPHELRMVLGRKKKRALAFNVEDNPGIVERFEYYDDLLFRDEQGRELFDPDPNHKKKA